MTLTPDDVPAREAMELGQRWGQRFDEHARKTATDVATEIADEKVVDHEERMHVPIRDMSPLTAVPFPERKIPDPQMKQMVELIEGEGLTVGAVAEMFGYPFSLASRELARYSARHQRMCLEWSLP